MTQRFCKFVLEKLGWTCIGEKAPEKTCVFLEAPHTSIWDFLMGYMYYRSKGGHLRTMIKKEAFFFPFGSLLRSMGGFPIDRSHPSKTILSIVHAMEDCPENETFHLVMCPEGTRKAVHKWKTGYHTIVQQTGAPLYLTIIDWGHKRIGVLEKFEITDNARADTDRIQLRYEQENVIGKHPEKFLTR